MEFSVAWVTPAVVAQRLVGLRLSARNRRRLCSRGGIEVRAETYRAMVALHVLFLISLANLLILRHRIRIEEEALREATDYAERFRGI